LLRAILDWSKQPEGRLLLDNGTVTPLVPARDSEYDSVRSYLRAQ
jgi:hypothetical protein